MACHVRLRVLCQLAALLLAAAVCGATQGASHRSREHHRKIASMTHASQREPEGRSVKALVAVMVRAPGAEASTCVQSEGLAQRDILRTVLLL